MAWRERWDERIREEHRSLESQVEVLERILTVDVSPEDRRGALRWLVGSLRPLLEMHLEKEEGTLFPALEHHLGKEADPLEQLRDQHRELRSAVKELTELLQGSRGFHWAEVAGASRLFVDLWEDHEKKEDRLLLDVLEFGLRPQELNGLAQALR
ncbi:MAG: hemerythrin domain-containing protein [Candidatus Omnitrophica bacterium]|nr:hemerythrin domain-containing protein [Candidatus Omnitrophota bacterium]